VNARNGLERHLLPAAAFASSSGDIPKRNQFHFDAPITSRALPAEVYRAKGRETAARPICRLMRPETISDVT